MVELTGGASIEARLRDNKIGEALRHLHDMIEAAEETPGPLGAIAIDAVAGLARAYGEAMADLIAHLASNSVVVHDLRRESDDRRALRIIAKVAGPSNARGGCAELATLEDTMPMLQLPARGRESVSAADIVRKAVLAAVPELSDVTVVFGPASTSVANLTECVAAAAVRL